jgi:hypothetical protein
LLFVKHRIINLDIARMSFSTGAGLTPLDKDYYTILGVNTSATAE